MNLKTWQKTFKKLSGGNALNRDRKTDRKTTIKIAHWRGGKTDEKRESLPGKTFISKLCGANVTQWHLQMES